MRKVISKEVAPGGRFNIFLDFDVKSQHPYYCSYLLAHMNVNKRIGSRVQVFTLFQNPRCCYYMCRSFVKCSSL